MGYLPLKNLFQIFSVLAVCIVSGFHCTILDQAPSACVDEIKEYAVNSRQLLSTRFECRDNILRSDCAPEFFKIGQFETLRLWNEFGSCRDLGYEPVNE